MCVTPIIRKRHTVRGRVADSAMQESFRGTFARSHPTAGWEIMYKKIVKRALDIFFSCISLVICSPVFLTLALWIRIDSKGSIFFRQTRIGKNRCQFTILKFRTMRANTPADIPTAHLANPDLYITKIGRFLRKTSLDELPQLINIFQGEMSFVGPRPALWNQEDLIALREACGANSILPGLTGLAQINGRDELPIPKKAQYDAKYTCEMSFLYDLRIVFGTAFSVIRQKGIQEGAQK
jgi:O-antigen biosynthesis protein WbqP